jgi:hypothetical protein
MDGIDYRSSIVIPTVAVSSKNTNDDLNMMIANLPGPDDSEADTLNDETFGDCDLDAIKIKSDFGARLARLFRY